VSHVVADDLKDIFSGVALQRGMLGDEVFAPAPLVDHITEDGVHLALTSEQAKSELRPFAR
jgi:hypothetical protein